MRFQQLHDEGVAVAQRTYANSPLLLHKMLLRPVGWGVWG